MNYILNFFLWRNLRKWAAKTVTLLDDWAVNLLQKIVSQVIDRKLTPKEGLMKLLEEGLQLIIRYWNNHRDDEKTKAFLIAIQKIIGSLDFNEK